MNPLRRVGLLSAVLLLGGGLFTALPAVAAPVTVTVDNITYSANDQDPDAGATVTGYNGTGGSIIIPDTVEIDGLTYDVVAIQSQTFQNKGITSAVIGNNVETIELAAFYDNAITSVQLGSSVKTIGTSAFNTNLLASLVVPDSVVSIGDRSFSGNLLTSLTLGANVKTIGSGAFRDNSLTDLVVPDSVVSIGGDAFSDNPLESLTLGEGVETIGNNAFRNHAGLTRVVFPASLTSIGETAFLNDDQTLRSVRFEGAAPTLVPRTDAARSFDLETVIDYLWAHGTGNSGAFTSPTWQGYNSKAFAAIDFDMNGQSVSAPANQEVEVDQTAAKPSSDPAVSGYVFTGWFADSDGDTEFNFGAPITRDTTVYAGWAPMSDLVTVTKTVDATFVRRYEWTLNKTGQVASTVIDGDRGSAVVDYTIAATPDGYVDGYYLLSGEIGVTNHSDDVISVTVADIVDVGATMAVCYVLDANNDPAEDVEIEAGDEAVFSYDCYLEGTPRDGKNTAVVTWGDGGEVSFVADVVFTQRDTSFETITIVDDRATSGEAWTPVGEATWNSDGNPVTFEYSLNFDGLEPGACVNVTNVAMITETERTADATLEVCLPELSDPEVPPVTPPVTPPGDTAPSTSPKPTAKKPGSKKEPAAKVVAGTPKYTG